MKGSEIQNLVFSISLLGYKKSDIKACLREISEYVLKLEDKIYKLEIERDKLKDRLNKNELSQINFKEIIASAQEFKKRIEGEAQKKAEDIIDKAKKKYEEILKAIKIENSKFQMIKKEVENVRKALNEKLENFTNMLEIKEKNVLSREESTYKVDTSEFMKEDYNIKKAIKMVDSESTRENEENTIEFNTDTQSNDEDFSKKKKYNPEDNDYIKTRFNEIEF